MWVTFLIAGSPTEVNQRLKEKIISEHITMDWMVYPIFTINGFEINVFTIITLTVFCILIYRIYSVFSQVWGLIKMWAGHILMLSLWGWFTLIGDEKNSMLCLRSPSEKRSLLFFYGFILVCISLVIGMYLLQDYMSGVILGAFNVTHFSNETLTTTQNMTIIPVNISLGTVSDVI